MQANILIVDDDVYVREVLIRVVQNMGHIPIGVDSGHEALLLLDDPHGPLIDLMLTDIMMPNMNGVELLQRARELRPDVPVGIITGAATLDNSIAALNAGAYAYLVKPVRSDQVRDMIEKGLRLAESNREQQLAAKDLVARYQTLEDQLNTLIENQQRVSGNAVDTFEGLIRGLRHEIGNATTAIKLNLSVLEEAGSNSEILREHLQDLELSADELAVLVSRLKEYPGQNAIRDIVDLREALTALADNEVETLAANGLKLALVLPDEDLFVYGTDVEIMRACKHILNNAVEATVAAKGKQIEIAVTMTDDAVTITISDEGKGFPLELQDKLFSPGFTTKITHGVVRGLGLGLFIARATANLYGGEIRLENREQGGASVHIQWPAAGPQDKDKVTVLSRQLPG
jgi:signal transduction histidine kinase